jgi:GNAT superfamily N-acetyltransferase
MNLSVRGLNTDHYTAEQVETLLKYVFGIDTELIEDRTYFVVEEDGVIIGAGGWSRRDRLYGGDQQKADSPVSLPSSTTNAAHIRAFFVHPNWVRKGIGSLLMTTCEQAAREAGFRRLELLATLTGVPLYSRSGFGPIEEVTATFPDGNTLTGRLMAKDLTTVR